MVCPGCQPSPGRQRAVAHSGWGAVRVLWGRGAGLAPLPTSLTYPCKGLAQSLTRKDGAAVILCDMQPRSFRSSPRYPAREDSPPPCHAGAGPASPSQPHPAAGSPRALAHAGICHSGSAGCHPRSTHGLCVSCVTLREVTQCRSDGGGGQGDSVRRVEAITGRDLIREA